MHWLVALRASDYIRVFLIAVGLIPVLNMASTEIEFQPTNAKKSGPLARAKGFFWDPETKQFCGRTGASWGKCGVVFPLKQAGMLRRPASDSLSQQRECKMTLTACVNVIGRNRHNNTRSGRVATRVSLTVAILGAGLHVLSSDHENLVAGSGC